MRNREEMIKKAYSLSFPKDNTYAQKILNEKLEEDLGYDGDLPYGAVVGDITAESVLKHNKPVYGIIKAKEDGILAGLEEVTEFYSKNNVQVKTLKKDGQALKKGDIIAEIYANEKEFLKVERTGLNIMQRMSGVATATKKFADVTEPYGVKIVGTRKTLLNYLDKKAIELGNGLAHRVGLYDAILIKDNHLEAIREEGIENAIETAIERAYAIADRYKPNFIEIEVSTLEDVIKAAKKFQEIIYKKANEFFEDPKLEPKAKYEYIHTMPNIIMLDNMKPTEIKKTINALKKEGLYDYILLEASGNINEKNIKSYAKSGVDAISIGALTHSVRALDISQKIVRREK